MLVAFGPGLVGGAAREAQLSGFQVGAPVVVMKPGGNEGCPTCSGFGIVAVRWPESDYPHAISCPDCRPGGPCAGMPPELQDNHNCPGPAAIAEWRRQEGHKE